MKKITEAYEKNDLATLLELQITYLEKGEEAFAALSEERLKIFNRIFSQQISELLDEIGQSKRGIPNEILGNMEFYQVKDLNKLKVLLKQEEDDLNERIREIAQDIADCGDAKYMKKLIKEMYGQILEDEESEFFFMDL